MLRKLLTLVLPAAMLMVMAGDLSAQSSGSFGPGPEPDPLTPQASIWGGIGLWKVLSADTPPAKAWGTSG